MNNYNPNIPVTIRAPMPAAVLETQPAQNALLTNDGLLNRAGPWRRWIADSSRRAN